jgi:hypothetical protein
VFFFESGNKEIHIIYTHLLYTENEIVSSLFVDKYQASLSTDDDDETGDAGGGLLPFFNG